MNVSSPGKAALQKAKLSLEAAKDLAEKYPDFAVSRAYYAMFYAATAMLFSKNLSFKRHSAVIAAFGREFAKYSSTWQEHHQHLIKAESLRTEGDYDLYAHVEPDEVEMSLRQATFIKAAEDYLS